MQTRYKFLRQIEGRAWLIASGLIFRAALELAYKDFIVPFYEEDGFLLVDTGVKYIESWALYVGLLLLLPAKVRKPSDYLICMTFFAFLAPLLVFYSFADRSRWALYCVLAQYAILGVLTVGPPMRVAAVRKGPVIALGLAIAGVVVGTGWMIASGALATFNLNLDAVYQFREDAGKAINVGLMSYIVVWVPAVCGPLLLMRFLRDGRHLLALGIVLLHVFWFGMTAHKAVLFFPALVIFLHALFKHSRALSLIPMGLTGVVMVALISYYATESLLLSGLFVRRTFFTTSFLTFTYFEFYEQNPLVYWSNSFLSSFVNYPYDEPPPYMIARYLNDPTGWANNSFFSTGYMHAGYLGIVLYGLAAGALLKLIDSLVSTAVPIWMSLSIVVVPWFTLVTSADLPSGLLTHGLGLAIFMLYLMKVPVKAHGNCLAMAGEPGRVDSPQHPGAGRPPTGSTA